MPQEDLNRIKEQLNKAMARWWRRKRAIFSVIANATDTQKQYLLEDAALLARLDSKLRRNEMRAVLDNLNASIYNKIKVMHRWEGRYLPEIMGLLERGSEAHKQQIANDTAILSHIMTSYREDYQLQVVKHLNLLAAESFTNNPNNGRISFTSLMVLFQDRLVISKEVNFVPAGTFSTDKLGIVPNKAKFEALKARFITAVTNYLSNKYKLKIESHEKQDEPVSGEYPIIVKLTHNPAADYRLFLHGGIHDVGNLGLLRGDIYELGQIDETLVPDVYLAHEGAHLMLGANDEYASPQVSKNAVYTDNSLMGDFYKEGMQEAEIKVRHFQFLLPLLKRWFPELHITLRIIDGNTEDIL